jgi:hypothetical protein
VFEKKATGMPMGNDREKRRNAPENATKLSHRNFENTNLYRQGIVIRPGKRG